MSADQKLISFGIIADLQHCSAPTFKKRYYQNSIKKLQNCIEHLNRFDLDFVVNLGDLIDRDWESFDQILPEFDQLNFRAYHVLGNHDYEVEEKQKVNVPAKISTDRYYSFSLNHWRFIVLDGNEISTFANPMHSENFRIAEEWLHKMETSGDVNGNFYNGGIGRSQINWLESELEVATKNHESVIIFCHYPLFPANKHNLLNNHELLSLLKNYKGVKMWMNGHNHKGNYGLFEDVHFVNAKGMVEGEHDMAWSVVSLLQNRIEITGFGNEISARLVFN